ncbi:hypothetical protein P20652_1646 [Pseudoalteromonas sp. BSi20652]|uniref:hypothetical protein n=1 Tax=Pseudoalteromonas sp. BSi20652 TaxID=388384 RepID=UPI0002317056|nr:hypothetical protein [Pseudoalteromonas sp. BSi20652]GAA59782.1 hypothetical protein P20652_1646 [Pseudoalteromonas sp. BSi20652]
MKKFIYAAAVVLLLTILGALFGGIISEKSGFLESFKAYGFICLPLAAVTYFAGLRANQAKAKYEVSNKLTKNKK